MGTSCSKKPLTDSILPNQNNSQEENNNQSNKNDNEITEKQNNIKASIDPAIPNTQAAEPEKKNSKEENNLTIREQLRIKLNFHLSIEKLNKESYLQFLLINEHLMLKKIIHQPFEWLDENIEQKLIEAVKNADKDAELMADHIWWKATSFCDCHPETMPLYVEVLKWGDYKWQMLNRLLLIYQRYKNEIDAETMNWYHNVFEQMEEENIKTYFN